MKPHDNDLRWFLKGRAVFCCTRLSVVCLPTMAALAALILWPAMAMPAQLPALPQSTLDTTYAPPVGNTITVNAGSSFQAALNNAQLGDTIVLQAGATFAGPFNLPNKTSGSGWVYIVSSAYGQLPPPGTRVSPTDAPSMPKLAATAESVITTSAGAHHFRFVGIEFKPTSGSFIYSLIAIGNRETSVGTLPNNITFDRCYVHGDPSVGGRRGIAMDGIAVAAVDSYISDFKEVGADSQAAWVHNSPGPIKLVNNHLEAAGENFMSGGADPAIANLVPSDIEIRRNRFYKPLSWMGSAWSVKNLLEFKNGQRILVEGNLFENNWPAAQNGFSVLITPRNQSGGAPWSITQDITFRLNKMINVGQGFNISGTDTGGAGPSQTTRRLLIENNVIEVTSLNGADGKIFGITNGPVDTTIRHNTGFSAGTMGFSENSPKADQFDFRDNLLSSGPYGFIGTGSGTGTGTLNTYYINYTFVGNAIIGGAAGSYPAGNFFPASTGDVGFVGYSSGNYMLSSTSSYKNAATDGKDIGADIAALTSALAGTGGAMAPARPTNLRRIP